MTTETVTVVSIDILVDNGRYVGPGHMDRLVDTPVDLLDRHLEADVMALVIPTELVLPQMVDRGGGTVINPASSCGTTDPPRPAGRSGSGLGYGRSKAGLHRHAGTVAVELRDRGILACNLSPGFVAPERIEAQEVCAALDLLPGGRPPRPEWHRPGPTAPPDALGMRLTG